MHSWGSSPSVGLCLVKKSWPQPFKQTAYLTIAGLEWEYYEVIHVVDVAATGKKIGRIVSGMPLALLIPTVELR